MLIVSLDHPDGVYLPGSTMTVKVQRDDDSGNGRIELVLFWYTDDEGYDDSVKALTSVVETFPGQSRYEVKMVLPEGPYSFSGSLIKLCWRLEVTEQPGGMTAMVDFALQPGKEPLVLSKVQPPQRHLWKTPRGIW
ncbi:MAG: hypothetical protein PHQ27_10790 [Victivallales bacterium]|nr:hypothetical protein [Victivallales bacterium]